MKKFLSLFLLLLLFSKGTGFAQDVKETDSTSASTGLFLNERESSDSDPAGKKGKDVFNERKKFNQLTKPTVRISKIKIREDVVFKLQTAMGYVSAIQLPETALKVFVGDQGLFKVGVYEKEVLIKPITDYEEAKTNLTIVMKSGRLTFEVSVGSPETADFILDFRDQEDDAFIGNEIKVKVDEKSEEIKKTYEEKEKKLDEKVEQLSKKKITEALSEGTKTLELKTHSENGDIRLNLLSIAKVSGKNYLRFSIQNSSDQPFQVSKVVLGLEAKEKGNSFIEIPTELQLENTVPGSGYVYGVLEYEGRKLKEGQKPVLLLFGDDGRTSLKVKKFKWLE